jgi:hypothetical protein
MSQPKKNSVVTPSPTATSKKQVPDPRSAPVSTPERSKAEITALVEKLREKLQKDPDKMARLIREWMSRPAGPWKKGAPTDSSQSRSDHWPATVRRKVG